MRNQQLLLYEEDHRQVQVVIQQLLRDADALAIFVVDMNGQLVAETGELHWKGRLDGKYSASPTYADGRIYWQSEEGHTTVTEATTEGLEILAESDLEGRTFASYAVAHGAIFLRTEQNLYRLQK